MTDKKLLLLQKQSAKRYAGKQTLTNDQYKNFIAKRKPFKKRPKKVKPPKPITHAQQKKLDKIAALNKWQEKQSNIKSLAAEIDKKLGIENNL